MGKDLEFEVGKEWHYDTGEVWTGYLIDTKSKKIDKPDDCIECGRWFVKSARAHSVHNQYVYHEVEGHDIRSSYIGLICHKCYKKVKSDGEFRKGKIR